MADSNSIKVKFKKNNNITTYPVTTGECIEDIESNTDYKAVKNDVAALKAKVSNINNSNVDSMQTDLSEIKQQITKLQSSDNTKTSQIADILNRMVTVVDNLYTADSSKALSANQGKVLKGLVDNLDSTKLSGSDCVDNLTTTTKNKPLSANQGKAITDLLTGKYGYDDVHKGTSDSPVNLDKINDIGVHLIRGNITMNSDSLGNLTIPGAGNSELPQSGILIVFNNNFDNVNNNTALATGFPRPIKVYIPSFIAGSPSGIVSSAKIPLMFVNQTSLYMAQHSLYNVWAPVYFSLGNNTDWTSITLNSNFTEYTDQAPMAKQVSGVVYIRGAVKNTAPVGDTTFNNIRIGKLPSGISAPSGSRRIFLQQGSGSNKFCLTIDTSGNIGMERYGTTSIIQVPSGSWLNLCCSYAI